MLTTVIGFCELVYFSTGTKLINSGIFTNCQTSTCGAQCWVSILPWLLGISFCSAVQGTMGNQSYTVKNDREILRLSRKSHKWHPDTAFNFTYIHEFHYSICETFPFIYRTTFAPNPGQILLKKGKYISIFISALYKVHKRRYIATKFI